LESNPEKEKKYEKLQSEKKNICGLKETKKERKMEKVKAKKEDLWSMSKRGRILLIL